MTTTRRITITIPAHCVETLCRLECPGLLQETPSREPRCALFPRKSDGYPRWLTKDGTGYPTRCGQCLKAEVE